MPLLDHPPRDFRTNMLFVAYDFVRRTGRRGGLTAEQIQELLENHQHGHSDNLQDITMTAVDLGGGPRYAPRIVLPGEFGGYFYDDIWSASTTAILDPWQQLRDGRCAWWSFHHRPVGWLEFTTLDDGGRAFTKARPRLKDTYRRVVGCPAMRTLGFPHDSDPKVGRGVPTIENGAAGRILDGQDLDFGLEPVVGWSYEIFRDQLRRFRVPPNRFAALNKLDVPRSRRSTDQEIRWHVKFRDGGYLSVLSRTGAVLNKGPINVIRWRPADEALEMFSASEKRRGASQHLATSAELDLETGTWSTWRRGDPSMRISGRFDPADVTRAIRWDDKGARILGAPKPPDPDPDPDPLPNDPEVERALAVFHRRLKPKGTPLGDASRNLVEQLRYVTARGRTDAAALAYMRQALRSLGAILKP